MSTTASLSVVTGSGSLVRQRGSDGCNRVAIAPICLSADPPGHFSRRARLGDIYAHSHIFVAVFEGGSPHP